MIATLSYMARSKIELGATGKAVAANIKATRESQNLTFAELSRRLTAIGQPIPELGLRRIEKEERKVDVDELLAFCSIFKCTPLFLIVPPTAEKNDKGQVTGFEDLEITKAVCLFMYGWYDVKKGERVRYLHKPNYDADWEKKGAEDIHPELARALRQMYESLKDLPGIESNDRGER